MEALLGKEQAHKWKGFLRDPDDTWGRQEQAG